MFSFFLSDIVCLRQLTPPNRWNVVTNTDELYALVEYNYSPASIKHNARNKYKLGTFASSQIGQPHAYHNGIRCYTVNFSHVYNAF